LMIEKQVVEAVQEPVYIEFIVDKYMVYVGDCQNREEANILKNKITELGFDRVYSVPKKVYKKTPPLEIVSSEAEDQENEDAKEIKINEKFDQVIGYRVQIFAAREKSNAEKIKAQASEQIEERIYLVLADDGLYKIQVGDFLSKIEADKVRDRIRQTTNYNDAFIQNTHVFYENKSLKGGYYVQVGAFSGMDSAKDFESGLNSRGYENTKVENIDGLYKVFIGEYNTENEAENIKKSLLNDGMEGVMIIKK
ncbi:MAG: SPOR domain-containing protein, partial [Candidatus Delongbacteria bacterium]